MTIEEIYSEFRIMPNLQTHQLRVAGVAQMICESMTGVKVDLSSVVSACLLHDMGNIIKFRLDRFPEFLEPAGESYWAQVQKDYISKYGKDEHIATMEISKNILTSQLKNIENEQFGKIISILGAIGFSKTKLNYKSDNYNYKIAAYSDMRVCPIGVTSMENRLGEGRKRFNALKKHGPDDYNENVEYLKKIETQIFDKCRIRPEDITEDAVQNIIPRLRSVFHNKC